MKNKTFKVDKAITSKNEDLFGRKKIAMVLARTIKYYKDKDSVSIGIIGDWGSGKTSFINMVLESLSINKKIVIINFNPWNISTRKQLISDFFTILSKEICKVPFPEFKCRNLKKYILILNLNFFLKYPKI